MFNRKKSVDLGQPLNVPAASLQPWEMSGFLGRQGKRFHKWESRFFVLKGQQLYYFVNNTSVEASGVVTLDNTCVLHPEKDSGKQAHVFSIEGFCTNKKEARRRKLLLSAPTPECQQEWIDAIEKACNISENSPAPTTPTTTTAGATTPTTPVTITVSPSDSAATTPVTTIVRPEGQDQVSAVMVPASDTEIVADPVVTVAPPDVQSAPAQPDPNASAAVSVPVVPAGADDCAAKMIAAHTVFAFLTQGTKMEKFWDAWMSSIPPLTDVDAGRSMLFSVVTSIGMENTIWRVSGPQSLFAQRIVQLFWKMGAPAAEVDRMNDVGALINPRDIGSWIQTSLKGGMDGGWVFPDEVPLKLAVEAADSVDTDSDATRIFSTWADKHGILVCRYLSRDMGKSPPQQTEFRMVLPGADFPSQLSVALDAMNTFQFPGLPDAPVTILANAGLPGPMMLSIVTCAKGFVSLGIIVPQVPMDVVSDLIQNCGGKQDEIQRFMDASGCTAPSAVELQCLMKGYGYGVYKEGFDMLFHWDIGTETRT